MAKPRNELLQCRAISITYHRNKSSNSMALILFCAVVLARTCYPFIVADLPGRQPCGRSKHSSGFPVGRIIPIRTHFRVSATLLADGKLLIFNDSTLLPRDKRASLACSKQGYQLPIWLRGTTPTRDNYKGVVGSSIDYRDYFLNFSFHFSMFHRRNALFIQ